MRFYILLAWRLLCCCFLKLYMSLDGRVSNLLSWPRSQSRFILCAFCCTPFCNYVCSLYECFIINCTWQELHANCKYSETVSEIELLRRYFINVADYILHQTLTQPKANCRVSFFLHSSNQIMASVLVQKKREGTEGDTLGTKKTRLAKTWVGKCFS